MILKTRAIFLLVSVLFIMSCSSRKHTAVNQSNSNSSFTLKDGNGLSYATAIVISEKSESTGVAAEYAWIKEHYIGYTIKKQSLSNYDKKPFDIITITQSNGKDLPLYFDISNYFGKF